MSTVLQSSPQCQPEQTSDFLSPEGGLIVLRLTEQKSCRRLNLPMLKFWHQNSQQVIYFQPSCKCNTCPECAPKRAKRHVYEAVYGCEVLTAEGRKIDFITVTSHEKLDAAGSLAVLNSAWPKLNRRIKHLTDDHEYFLIPELHANGRVHLHALTTAHLSKKSWKDIARECGFGYQSDVKEVNSIGGVSNYCAKYIGKGLGTSAFPRRFRRVRMSQGWPELPALERPAGWQGTRLEHGFSLQDEVDRLTETGWTVVLADEPGAWFWMAKLGASPTPTK